VEQLQLDTFANDNASKAFEQKQKEFLQQISKLE
jgi:hypothetical protein